MTKIKLCGLSRVCDIEWANRLKPEYIGFVFAPKSRRYISRERAAELKGKLDPEIKAVGVFVNEDPEAVLDLLKDGIIDIAQLHGSETEDYIRQLRMGTDKQIIKAVRIDTPQDVIAAQSSSADYILLDSGSGGTGKVFDWELIRQIGRPYFLAGGLSPHNAAHALSMLNPYAVDVSSGIETDGQKDPEKMQEFVTIIRKEEAK
ncbi:MAG: phosphoribosylanthranilate isomerase [Oscillospiraceae bacterium]|nr:phosphoribosylanthranilate isomerase [Oscillospiraceae bacterium]